MQKESLVHTRKTLEKFITTSLTLDFRHRGLPAPLINYFILSSCVYHTYVETISNKADTLFRYIKDNERLAFTFSYLYFIKQVSKKINLNKKKVVLGFDYTNETFWGDVQGFDIYGTRKSEKGTGAFKFLTCSQVSGKLHAKIPLISIPVHKGHDKAHAIMYCISLLKDYIGEIELILGDKEFYVKDIMLTLNEVDLPYLLFVKKSKGEIQDTLASMYPGETKTKVHKFDVNKDKTVYRDETCMAFLKAIFDGRSYKHFDWCFVTNVEGFSVNKMVPTYKCRWRIETGFRVQDEAGMKTKTKEMTPRYFFFLYEQLLQSIWYVFFKHECSFKQFIIILKNFIEVDMQLEGSEVHINVS